MKSPLCIRACDSNVLRLWPENRRTNRGHKSNRKWKKWLQLPCRKQILGSASNLVFMRVINRFSSITYFAFVLSTYTGLFRHSKQTFRTIKKLTLILREAGKIHMPSQTQRLTILKNHLKNVRKNIQKCPKNYTGIKHILNIMLVLPILIVQNLIFTSLSLWNTS